jgi:hypothetical protein
LPPNLTLSRYNLHHGFTVLWYPAVVPQIKTHAAEELFSMTSSDRTDGKVSRREFLRMGGVAVVAVGALLAGCRPSGTANTTSEGRGQANPLATVATATALVDSAASSPAAAATATPAAQQNLGVACPFGLVNDRFPGRCKRYRDSDGNGYCDFSVLGSGDMPARST